MKILKVIIGMVFLSTTACGPFQSAQKLIGTDLNEIDKGNKVAGSNRPYCEIDFADYLLDTQLLGLEITDKTNIGFGFNLVTGFFRALGLNLKTEKGKMTMSMHMTEATRPVESIASIVAEGESKKTEFNMSLDLLRLGLDFGYYKETPISKLTEKTLNNSLSRLNTAMARVETPWNTRVVANYPEVGQVIVPVGSVAGIKTGDRFQAFNVDYVWMNEPCKSELLMVKKRSKSPLAILEAIQVEKNATLMTLVQYRSEEAIEIGARVEIEQLTTSAGRNLLRAVRLREFRAPPLTLENGQQVDLSLHIREQIQALMVQHGYYPRK